MSSVLEYDLIEEIGRGGGAVVHRARRRSSGDEVALKCRLPGGAAATAQREASVLARLVHPYVVPLLDVVEVSEDRPVALVLGLARGGSLAGLLARRRALRSDEVAGLTIAIADALHAVHEAGFCHADVKPANVLFRADGHPWLADFDAAVSLSPGRATPVRNTPSYQAPEVESGAAADARSDLFALALVALESLRGAHCGGEDAHAAPSELAEVLDRARHPDPDQRPASAALFASELRAACPQHRFPLVGGHQSQRHDDEQPTREVTLPWPVEPVAPAEPSGPRRRWVRAATVGGAAALAATTAGLVVHQHLAAPSAARLEVDGRDIDIHVGDQTRRYTLGRDGDIAIAGDWDGDGTDAPALYRPSDGTVHLFENWQRADDVLTPTRSLQTGVPQGRPQVVRRGDHDEVLVAAGDP